MRLNNAVDARVDRGNPLGATVILVAVLLGTLAVSSVDASSSLPPYHLVAIEDVDHCGGLRPLATGGSSAGKEVRVWIYEESTAPSQMFRFVITDSGTAGEAYVWWHEWRGVKSMVRRESSGWSCHDLKACGSTGICRRAFASPPDWSQVYDQLTALGLWELPDESTLPPIAWDSNDGTTLIVELCDGADYRIYSYYNQRPPFSHAPEAQKAWDMRILLERTCNVASGRPPG